MSSLVDWLARLESLDPNRIELGLDRLRPVAERLKVIHWEVPVVVVGGTNGKGSTVAYLASIYRSAGYRVFAYTSPHLMRFNERIQSDGVPIDDASLCAALEAVEKAREGIPLTYFEYTTLAALCHARRVAPEVLLLEIGMGGRCDAVNVVEPSVTAITSVDLDHQAFLGPTREAITREKIGIARAGVPLVCGDPHPPVSLMEGATEKKALLYRVGVDFAVREDGFHSVWGKAKALPRVQLSPINLPTVLAIVSLLQDRLPVSDEGLRYGLTQARLSGRFEKIEGLAFPTWVDVSHNPAGLRYLASRVREETSLKGRLHLAFSMLSDKDLRASLAALDGVITGEVVLVPLDHPRAASGAELCSAAELLHRPVFMAADAPEALRYLNERIEPSGGLLVCGSFVWVEQFLKNL